MFSTNKGKQNMSAFALSDLFHSFIPETLKCTLSSLNLDMSTDANRGFRLKSKPELQTV